MGLHNANANTDDNDQIHEENKTYELDGSE